MTVAGDLAEHHPRRRTAEATAIIAHYMQPSVPPDLHAEGASFPDSPGTAER